MASDAAEDLKVRVQTPTALVWEGIASAVSSRNEVGPFDVLPDHSNMITLVESPITVVTGAGEKKFSFSKAVISVRDNTVSIYADILSDDPLSSARPSPAA